MITPKYSLILPLAVCFLSPLPAEETALPERASQYAYEAIDIPGAFAEEPIRKHFSLQAALTYVEQGADAWTKKRDCVSCHTNGSYLLTRPALSKVAGPPNGDMRQFFVEQLGELKKKDREKLKGGITPTQIAYIAAGLAEWDRHVTKKRSLETNTAIRLMFDAQADDGSLSNEACWRPLESSNYHGATVAATATASAPGWLEDTLATDQDLSARYQKLTSYLCKTKPPHDYGRLLLLWASAQLPDLIDAKRKAAITESVWAHQQADGGWSLRTFATPETWGSGNRAEKLRAEPELKNPPSDGHMTGLALLVLREVGIAKSDPRIEKGVQWLKANQRE
ncbi:MAG: hypothetical protein ACKVHP_13710, partial [Verrucomicrobiales bacterium]